MEPNGGIHAGRMYEEGFQGSSDPRAPGSLTSLMFSHKGPLGFVKLGDLNLHLGSVTCLMTKEHGTSSW